MTEVDYANFYIFMTKLWIPTVWTTWSFALYYKENILIKKNVPQFSKKKKKKKEKRGGGLSIISVNAMEANYSGPPPPPPFLY